MNDQSKWYICTVWIWNIYIKFMKIIFLMMRLAWNKIISVITFSFLGIILRIHWDEFANEAILFVISLISFQVSKNFQLFFILWQKFIIYDRYLLSMVYFPCLLTCFLKFSLYFSYFLSIHQPISVMSPNSKHLKSWFYYSAAKFVA